MAKWITQATEVAVRFCQRYGYSFQRRVSAKQDCKVFVLSDHDKQRLYLKVYPSRKRYLRERFVLTRFRGSPSLAVPRIVRATEDVWPKGTILFAELGRPVPIGRWTDYAVAAAEQLHRHYLPAPAWGEPFAPTREVSLERALLNEFRNHVTPSTPRQMATDLTSALEYLISHNYWNGPRYQPVLTHGDPWPGNWLLRKKNDPQERLQLSFCDFEKSLFARPERDIARLILHRAILYENPPLAADETLRSMILHSVQLHRLDSSLVIAYLLIEVLRLVEHIQSVPHTHCVWRQPPPLRVCMILARQLSLLSFALARERTSVDQVATVLDELQAET